MEKLTDGRIKIEAAKLYEVLARFARVEVQKVMR
jgi:hypothetical protein